MLSVPALKIYHMDALSSKNSIAVWQQIQTLQTKMGTCSQSQDQVLYIQE